MTEIELAQKTVWTPESLARVILDMDDVSAVAKLIDDAMTLAKTSEQDPEDIVKVIVFLFYLMEEKGENLMYGSRKLGDAFEAACRLCKLQPEDVKSSFKDNF